MRFRTCADFLFFCSVLLRPYQKSVLQRRILLEGRSKHLQLLGREIALVELGQLLYYLELFRNPQVSKAIRFLKGTAGVGG